MTISIRCRRCYCHIRNPQAHVGGRCPECLEPLYERARVPVLVFDEPAEDENLCAVHPHSLAVATCRRCGNYMCPVCWTRWRQLPICTECIERARVNPEAEPRDTRLHFQQALWSLILGVASWLLMGCVVLLVMAATAAKDSAGMGAVAIAGFVIMLSPCLCGPGVGLGAAAIRTRGDHMILATSGLLLSAMQAGVLIGLFAISYWNH